MSTDLVKKLEGSRTYTLGELAKYINAELCGDEACSVSSISTLKNANSRQLSFLSSASYQKYLSSTQAACVILHPDMQHLFTGNKLVTNNPYYAYAQLTELFVPQSAKANIHTSVVVGENSTIGLNVTIGAYTVIGDNVHIADGVTIGSGCFIGDNTTIAESTVLHSQVSIYRDVTIGQGSLVHSHVVLGSDGFGFAPKKGSSNEWQKIHQLGGVIIGDDVEIGAGTTIDRGALDNTIIANGVKLDNQIQIAHNVEIGEHTAIAAATAIAGSTIIGQRCTIAGAVGIVGHLTITDDVHITAMTLVTKSITTAGSYSSGVPMNKTSVWRKNAARFNRLDQILRK